MSTPSRVIDRRVLSNGLTLLMEQDARFRSAAIAVYIVSGLSDETEESAGITHLLEHLLFRRTKRKSNRDISLWIDDVGGDVNAFTDPLSLCLHGLVPASRAGEVLDLFAELLLESDPEASDFELEREVIRQEILESEDDPDDVVYQNFNRGCWQKSMLRFPVFGTIELLQRFTLKQIRTRLRELLQGSRIIIGAVGNIDPEVFAKRVEEHFGALPSGVRPKLITGEPSSGVHPLDRPGEQVHLILGMPWPAILSPDQFPGQLFAVAFGAGVSSRLFQLLREERGLVYDAGCEIDHYPGSAILQISAAVDPSNLKTVLELILGELEKVRKDPLQAAELERAKRTVITQLEMESDSLGARLWRTVEGEVFHGRYQSVEESIAKLQEVDLDGVSRVVGTWIKPEASLLSITGDLGAGDPGAGGKSAAGNLGSAVPEVKSWIEKYSSSTRQR